jgi:hypothetical protein
MPLANALLTGDQLEHQETRYPLEAVRCLDCGLMQLTVVVEPEVLFGNYLYTTSASTPMIQHFSAYADRIVPRFVPVGAFVVEIGSNDGVLLQALRDRGARPVGVEPAGNLAAHANNEGLETWNEFFSVDLARRMAQTHGLAEAVVANNVLAHVDDLEDMMSGVKALLSKTGVFVAEVPYLVDLLEHVEYDTIYHEHLSYFAIGPLVRLFERAGLELFDVQRQQVHGGSVRVFAGWPRRHERSPRLTDAIKREREAGLAQAGVYEEFARRIRRSRDALRTLVSSLKSEGRVVAALGASAKGNTLLNYCGLTSREVSFVADSTPLKQGLFTPGTRIPIREERVLLEERPYATILLAWNYADAIIPRFASYLSSGGRFIHPIPEARVIAA